MYKAGTEPEATGGEKQIESTLKLDLRIYIPKKDRTAVVGPPTFQPTKIHYFQFVTGKSPTKKFTLK